MKLLRVILIVLLLGVCTLWVASYWRIKWVSSDGLNNVALWEGGFIIGCYGYDIGEHGLITQGFYDLSTRWWPVVWIFTNPDRNFKTNWFRWNIRGTFWLPTLLLALPLAISVNPWARRRRRAKQGLCIRCGYDLQGTDHEVCPECGDPTSRSRQ